MSTLLINSEKEEDLNLFLELAHRLGLTAKVLSKDEKEEIGLHNAMVEGRKTKFVSKEAVMKKLKS